MKIPAKSISIPVLLGVISSLVAIAVKGDELWYSYGWRSPSEIDLAIMQASDNLSEFAAEWRCSEWDEELAQLLDAQRAGDDTTATSLRIARLEVLITQRDCARFDT